jgi:hypothetical protein
VLCGGEFDALGRVCSVPNLNLHQHKRPARGDSSSDDSLYSLPHFMVNETENFYQGRLFDIVTVNGSQFVESCIC